MRKKKDENTAERNGKNAGTVLPNGTEEEPVRLLNELQQSEEQYRTVVEDLTETIYRFKADGTLTFVNDVHCRLFGKTRDELVGRTWQSFAFPAEVPIFEEQLSRLSPTNPVVVIEKRINTASGDVLWMQFVNRGGFDSGGRLIEIQTVGRDITERKLAEEKIKKLNAELLARSIDLENANRELKAFNYMASHDLRRPLSNIFTSSQAIGMMCGDKLDEECRALLQVIKNGAMNMSNLIGKLRKLSASEHAELHRKKIDLSDMARVVSASLRLGEPERRVTIEIDEGVAVNGDPELIRVVLKNLFENAWKYTADIENATIEFGATEIDGSLTCFIRDNGPGFEMQEADKLFLPFERLTGSSSTGHGIGLATAERIIRRHGGKIWALAEPGRGATFFFTLGE